MDECRIQTQSLNLIHKPLIFNHFLNGSQPILHYFFNNVFVKLSQMAPGIGVKTPLESPRLGGDIGEATVKSALGVARERGTGRSPATGTRGRVWIRNGPSFQALAALRMA